jgi:hypothetical protein
LKEQYPAKRPWEDLDYNTGADSYTAMKRTACNDSTWKAANQLKDKKKTNNLEETTILTTEEACSSKIPATRVS